MEKLSHIDEAGNVKMVNVSQKEPTYRTAKAFGKIFMKPETLKLIIDGKMPKGDVLACAKIAGIMAAKNTSTLIPMCHQIPLDVVEISFESNLSESSISIWATASCYWKTGVEMESLTAVSVAGLVIYDMCKAVDKTMEIGSITLIDKTGGKSDYHKGAEAKVLSVNISDKK